MSTIPLFAKRFMKNVQPHGDLYGPFWVASTLVVSSIIGGDISKSLMANGDLSSTHYFGKVTSLCMLIYLYWWVAPLAIMTILYLRTPRASNTSGAEDAENLLTDTSSNQHTTGHRHTDKYFELLCVYGYSLTVFIPITLLWAFSNSAFQWILLTLAVTISGVFLFLVLLPGFRRDRPLMAVPAIVTILVVHVVFAVVLLYTDTGNAYNGGKSAMYATVGSFMESPHNPILSSTHGFSLLPRGEALVLILVVYTVVIVCYNVHRLLIFSHGISGSAGTVDVPVAPALGDGAVQQAPGGAAAKESPVGQPAVKQAALPGKAE